MPTKKELEQQIKELTKQSDAFEREFHHTLDCQIKEEEKYEKEIKKLKEENKKLKEELKYFQKYIQECKDNEGNVHNYDIREFDKKMGNLMFGKD